VVELEEVVIEHVFVTDHVSISIQALCFSEYKINIKEKSFGSISALEVYEFLELKFYNANI
jgi:hypothetical protein